MDEKDDDKIPLFKSWNGWYVFVVVFLVILIILFELLTQKFG